MTSRTGRSFQVEDKRSVVLHKQCGAAKVTYVPCGMN